MSSDRVFFIAEAGANHNRDYRTAIKLIDSAKLAGADAIKFQTYSSETLYSKNTPDFAGYKNISKLIKNIEMPRHWQKKLKEYCDKIDIEFMSTPFDEMAIKELDDLGVKRFKIAGFESTDPRFVKEVARTNKPIIFTAGIGSDLSMVGNVIEWIREEGNQENITVLHGNNAYPTPHSDICLGQISKIKETYPNVTVGLSDHTLGILIPPIAVAMGAKVIEKHFTLDKKAEGPDHKFAIDPFELYDLVDNIRNVESSLGSRNSFTKSEKNFKKAMRSVVCSSDIKKGEVLTADNVTTKRPLLENSIPALNYYEVLGKKANKDLFFDDILKTGDIEI